MTPASSLLERRALPLLVGYARISRLTYGLSSRPPRRLLITSTGGLGDGVMLNAIIHHLRACDPPLEVGVMARFGAKDALAATPSVTSHEYACQGEGLRGRRDLIRRLRASAYDAALATDHTSLTTAAILCLARIPRRIGFKPLCDCPQSRLYTESITLDERESQWESLVRLARLLQPSLSPSLTIVPITVTPEVEAKTARWWNQVVPRDARVVAMHLGAGVHGYKRWPVERFVETAMRLRSASKNLVPLLTGRAEERSLITQFIHQYPHRAIDAAIFDSVAETAAMVRRCDLLISNDSGVMHLGAAMCTPTIGLFGPTSPIQWAPLGPCATHVRGTELPCSPCIQNYRGATPARCTNPIASKCMLEITADDVVLASQRVAGAWLG